MYSVKKNVMYNNGKHYGMLKYDECLSSFAGMKKYAYIFIMNVTGVNGSEIRMHDEEYGYVGAYCECERKVDQ